METSFLETSGSVTLWGLLLNTGYLTSETTAEDILNGDVTFTIPNEEVKKAVFQIQYTAMMYKAALVAPSAVTIGAVLALIGLFIVAGWVGVLVGGTANMSLYQMIQLITVQYKIEWSITVKG